MTMILKNVRIEQVDTHSFVVKADTKRFGTGTVLFQDWNKKNAENWIKKTDPAATWTYKPLEVRTRISADRVPEYVRELVKEFEFSTVGDYEPGYTIVIRKPRPYMTVRVWRQKIERMISWALRYGADAWIDAMPKVTRHDWQHARVTITDPVMLVLEKVR